MRRVLAAVVTLAAAVHAFGQGAYTDHREPPASPGLERIDAVIAAFNSGDAATITACANEHFAGPFEEMVAERGGEAWRRALSAWGPVEFEAVRTYEPAREDLVVILRAPVIEGWRAFVMRTNDEGRFTGMQLGPARAPSYIEPSEPLALDEAIVRIDALLDRLAEHDMFSGTVLIAKDGDPVLERAVGLASRRFDVPNRMDTRFNLGSMNKMFTSVVIGQLVEEGLLSFEDTVGEHLPDFPNPDVRDRVQIRHLLSHTSGMGSHFTREFIEGSKALYRDFDEYLPLFQHEELAFDPGEQWAYSNAGFFVLGLIIEAVTEQSYYDAVRTRIYARAGMASSDSFDMDIPIKNLAVGYTRDTFGDTSGDDGERWVGETNGLRNNSFMHSIKGGPAGGGYSTAPDLIRFANALASGRLVSEAMLQTLTSPKPEIGSPNYGYGFGVEEHAGVGTVYGHSGGFPGINGMLDIYADGGIVVAVLANIDGGASLVGGRIMDLLVRGQ